jgi:hypothetical protein
MVGSEVATIWISRIAMNMPRHMMTNPDQVRRLVSAGTGSSFMNAISKM